MKKRDYQLINGAKGYVSKPDITATPFEYLVSPSQNVLINDQEKVVTREGYTIYGAEDASLYPIKSATVWKDNIGTEHFLREYNGNLQIKLTVSAAGASTTAYWSTILSGLSATYPCRFAPVWNGTELIDILLFVNHSSTLYEWSGGYGTYASCTAGTLVINETIAEAHFLANGTRKILVLDTGGTWRELTVTSQTASTFSVSDNPTGYTFAVGAPVIQSVRTNADKPTSGYVMDYIDVYNNHVFIGSASSRNVYVSKSTDYTSFAYSSPRVPTEGALFTLDDVTTGFKIGISGTGDEAMHVFSGRDKVFRINFELSLGDSIDREVLKTTPIINAPNQGAKSQELIGKTKNFIVFLNNNNELVELASTANDITIVSVPISDPIKPDFIVATFTNGQIFFDANSLYISAPTDGKVWIFDIEKKFWQPPQILPVRLFSNFAGDLYGHSNNTPETYKLFDTYDDNDKPFTSKAYWAYKNAGNRANMLNFDKYFVELYVSANATVTLKLLYEYGGSKDIKSYEFKGTESKFIYTPNPLASLGMNSLGTNPLGGYISEPETLLKYRRYKKIVAKDCYEYQVGFECEVQDGRFQVLSHGNNAQISQNYPVKIID